MYHCHCYRWQKTKIVTKIGVGGHHPRGIYFKASMPHFKSIYINISFKCFFFQKCERQKKCIRIWNESVWKIKVIILEEFHLFIMFEISLTRNGVVICAWKFSVKQFTGQILVVQYLAYNGFWSNNSIWITKSISALLCVVNFLIFFRYSSNPQKRVRRHLRDRDPQFGNCWSKLK